MPVDWKRNPPFTQRLGPLLLGAPLFLAACGGGGDGDIVAAPPAPLGRSCSQLSGLVMDATEFTTATEVPAGDFQPPTGAAITGLPAFCRVAATLRPTAVSNIKVEVWLPENWNGKYLGTGNGGLGGTIQYPALADGLRRGYAVANTDLGSSGGTASMVGKMDMIIDYGHRATHLMTVLAKSLVQARYASAPSRSYFFGCSTGGGQGMHETQRYPADYDGIVAGAPGAARVPAQVNYQWTYSAAYKDQTTYLTPQKRQLWATRVMDSCDQLDGVVDGIIGRPDLCTIDPGVMQCTGADSPGCLSTGQVDTLRKIYAGPKHAVTGVQIFPGYLRGTELSFPAEQPTPTSAPGFPFPYQWVWGMDWNWRTFDFGSDFDVMRNTLDFAVDGTNPDLTAYHARGGKIILFQGLADGIQAPGGASDYLKSVEARMPGESDRFIKLFNAPGMGHCSGGVGPNIFGNLRPGFPIHPTDPTKDVLAALEHWVEQGRVPTQIIATKYAGNQPTGAVERTRPLCAWPKVAKYDGMGDVNSAASFSCADPQ